MVKDFNPKNSAKKKTGKASLITKLRENQENT